MNGPQQIAGAAGVSLLLVNLWTSPARHTITAGAFNSSATAADTAAAHAELKRYAGAALGIIAVIVLAGTGNTGGKAAVAIMAALWVLWLMLHLGAAGSSSKPAAGKTNPTHRGTVGPRTTYAV